MGIRLDVQEQKGKIQEKIARQHAIEQRPQMVEKDAGTAAVDTSLRKSCHLETKVSRIERKGFNREANCLRLRPSQILILSVCTDWLS